MTNRKRKVEISLLGQRFTVRSEREEQDVHALADYVTKQLEEVRRQTKTVSTQHLALLVALNLADQIFNNKEKALREQTQVKSLVLDAIGEIDEALDQLESTNAPKKEASKASENIKIQLGT